MKCAILSPSLQPQPDAQAMVLGTLLASWDPSDYCLITQKDWIRERQGQTVHQPLPAQTFYLRPSRQIERCLEWKATWLNGFNPYQAWLLSSRVDQLERIIDRERCDRLVACTGDVWSIPEAMIVAERQNIPFFIYVFDYYAQQWAQTQYATVAQQMEATAFPNAAGIFVTNDRMAEIYRPLNPNVTVLHNPTAIDRPPHVPEPVGHDVTITYTGHIYEAHYDAFQRLVAAVTRLNRRWRDHTIKIVLATPQNAVRLRQNGIYGDCVEVRGYLSHDQALTLQSCSDILILPLAFSSPYPDLIDTSMPGKTGEYLASGVPVLVHAPATSAVTRYVQENVCGMVVDTPDTDALGDAIRHLIDDVSDRCRYSANARACARRDFDVTTIRKTFRSVIEHL